MTTPSDFVRQAVRAVPAVKWAIGVGGVIATISIIFSFDLEPRFTVIGTMLMILGMTLLFVFARLVAVAKGRFVLPALALTWFTLLLFFAICVALFLSVFFNKPAGLRHWLEGSQPPAASPVVRPVADSVGVRMNIRNITLSFPTATPRLYMSMSVAPSGSGPFVIDHLSLTLNATSMTGGPLLARTFALARSRSLDASVAVFELDALVSDWQVMSRPASVLPGPDRHWYSFHMNLQATLASTGQRIWLDVDAKQPSRMTCDFWCVSLYDLTLFAPAASTSRCDAISVEGKWKADCLRKGET